MPLFGPNIKKMKENHDAQGLIKALQNRNLQVQTDAVEALSELQDAPGLVTALRNDNGSVRLEAVRSLTKLKNAPGLLQAVKNVDPDVRLEAVTAISRLENSGEPNIVGAFVHILSTDQNDAIWNKAFDTLSNIQTVDAETWDNIATTLLKNKKYRGALRCFDRMVEIKPDREAFYHVAATLIGYGRPQDALKYDDKLVEIAPDDAKSWEAKATTLYLIDQYEEAIICGQKALDIDPKSESVRNVLIGIYRDKSDYSALFSIATETLEITPDNVMARITLSDCLKALSRLADAESEANIALEFAYKKEYVEPEVLGLVYSKLGLLYAMRGYKEQALTAFQKTIETEPKDEYNREMLDSYRILDAVGLILDGSPEDRERRLVNLSRTRLHANQGEGLSESELALSVVLRKPPTEFAWGWNENSWLNTEIQTFMLKVWPVGYLATAIQILERSGSSSLLNAFYQGLQERIDEMAG